MRLIDADRLTDVVEEIDWYHLHNGRMVHGANSDEHQPWYKSDEIYKAISKAPTVDAIPIEYIQYWIDKQNYGRRNGKMMLAKALNELIAEWRNDNGWHI